MIPVHTARRATPQAAAVLLLALLAPCAAAQAANPGPLPAADSASRDRGGPPAVPRTLGDSLAWARARAEAEAASGLRVVVSLLDRRLWLMDGNDTLRSAPVGIGTGEVLEHEGRRWRFQTPQGRRVVRAKAESPVWVPPDWHYAELGRKLGYLVVALSPARETPLRDGSRLAVRGRYVVRLTGARGVEIIPPDEEIVIDGTVFVPPFGTANRQVPAVLGAYKLELGDGYLIHGTPDEASVGTAATHGCLRLLADDLR
ncbi:MAG: L,D-transpeptidase, partial [Gemmatimonadetes bacterium]|nr:L,D-transpeptidase [Gemmatimonadota bacterium]